MANLKEIRGRITSISSTMQITSAMKMVSAAKLKKAQDAITMLRPYSEKLQELIQKVSTGAEGSLSEYAQKREVKKILYIAISSNRGLAGAFNSAIIKELNANYKNNEEVEIEVLTVGKKVFDAIRKTRTIYDNQSSIYDSMSFEAVAKLTSAVMADFKEEKFDEVYLVYNKFINAATQKVITEQLLPITMPEQSIEEESDYIFEPNKETILETLIPKSIKTQVYKAVLDSIASEHGARMTAMHKATDNAKALKNELVIYYNKARQAAITNEILEIVSGAEALKKG